MADGSVGSVFLDLVVRDTVDKQVQAMAEKAQATTQKSFAGMEQAISAAVEKAVAKATEVATSAASSASKAATQAADAAQKAVQAAASSATSCGQQVENSIDQSFSKSVAIAQSKVTQLEKAFDAVGAKLDALWNSGNFNPDDKATQSLLSQQEKLMAQLEAAQDRLAIEVQAAAQKRAAAEAAAAQKAEAADAAAKAKQEAAAQKAAAAAQKAAQQAAAAQEREAKKNEAAQQKAAQAAAKAHEQSAARIKNAFSKAFSGAKKMAGGFGKAVSGIKNKFSSVGKSAGSFGRRLKGLASRAFVFNIISSGLRSVSSYLQTAATSSDSMQTALANLKGAAATAAAPIIEALTPALTALTNAAATAFSYVSRLAAYLTGKSVSDMAKAAKAMQKASDAAKKSTAGFDEIEKLGNSDSDSPNYDFQGQSKLLDSALQAIQNGRWDQVGQIFAKKVNEIVSSLDAIDIGQKISGFINNLTSAVHGFFTTVDFSAIGQKLGAILTEIVKGTDWAKVGETAAAVLTSLPKMLVGIILETDWAVAAQSLSETIISAFNGVSDWIKSVDWRAVGDQVATFFKNVDWSGVATSLFEGIGSELGGLTAFLCGLLDEAWAAVVDWWYEVAFEDGSFTMSGLLEGIWAGICNIGQWLMEHVVNPFLNGFKEAFGIHSPSTVMAEIGDFLIQGFLGGITETWKKITTFLEDAFNGLKELIKGAINGILGFVNGLISGVCSGINAVIEAMNKLKWDVPDWVPVLGGKTFGFNLKTITAPQIPMLADGGVITQPTLAMMGEYAGAGSNPEIVAPQSLIAETVAGVMRELVESNLQGFGQIMEILRDILQAILGINRGDEVYGEAMERYMQKKAIMEGAYV